MPPPASLRLDFTAEPTPAPSPTTSSDGEPAGAAPSPDQAGRASSQRSPGAAPPPLTATIFGEEDELPPTWSEASTIFHTWSKCTRLQSIRRNRRITGNPGLREHCLNCISIAATLRRG